MEQTDMVGGLFGGPASVAVPTSRAAAQDAKQTVASKRLAALRWFRVQGERGGTADELDRFTGWGHQTSSARVTELHKAGLLQLSGSQRQTRKGSMARVYVVSAMGEAALRGAA